MQCRKHTYTHPLYTNQYRGANTCMSLTCESHSFLCVFLNNEFYVVCVCCVCLVFFSAGTYFYVTVKENSASLSEATVIPLLTNSLPNKTRG